MHVHPVRDVDQHHVGLLAPEPAEQPDDGRQGRHCIPGAAQQRGSRGARRLGVAKVRKAAQAACRARPPAAGGRRRHGQQAVHVRGQRGPKAGKDRPRVDGPPARRDRRAALQGARRPHGARGKPRLCRVRPRLAGGQRRVGQPDGRVCRVQRRGQRQVHGDGVRLGPILDQQAGAGVRAGEHRGAHARPVEQPRAGRAGPHPVRQPGHGGPGAPTRDRRRRRRGVVPCLPRSLKGGGEHRRDGHADGLARPVHARRQLYGDGPVQGRPERRHRHGHAGVRHAARRGPPARRDRLFRGPRRQGLARRRRPAGQGRVGLLPVVRGPRPGGVGHTRRLGGRRGRRPVADDEHGAGVPHRGAV